MGADRIRRMADDDSEATVFLDSINCMGFMGQRRSIEFETIRKVLRFFERIGEIYSGTFVRSKVIPSLMKFETDLHVRDSVWSHHQLITVKPREKRECNVLIPIVREI